MVRSRAPARKAWTAVQGNNFGEGFPVADGEEASCDRAPHPKNFATYVVNKHKDLRVITKGDYSWRRK